MKINVPASQTHHVQFYSRSQDLHSTLQAFISDGLVAGETCVVIASPEHRSRLQAALAPDHNLPQALATSQLVMLDAATTLDSFMRGGMPSRRLFTRQIETHIAQAEVHGKPIRAFGEMVALLWQSGNKVATLRLEELWNSLARQHQFSLYCAYPELHFMMDRDVLQEIRAHHTGELTTSA